MATEGHADMLISIGAAVVTEEGTMMSWFWLNIPLAVLFFCCWAGIPLWLTLARWDAELKGKHAEVAARAAAEAAFARPVAVGAHESDSPVYAAAAGLSGR
jgi:hypothetical protein